MQERLFLLTLHWFVISPPFLLPFWQPLLSLLSSVPFTHHFYFCMLKLFRYIPNPLPARKKTHQNHKNHSFMRSSRQASCFCDKHKISSLLENLADHDRVYLCSLETNAVYHRFLHNPLFLLYSLFFRHCQVWWLLSGIQLSNPFLSLQEPSTPPIHQVPKRLPVKLSTSGQKHFLDGSKKCKRIMKWSPQCLRKNKNNKI